MLIFDEYFFYLSLWPKKAKISMPMQVGVVNDGTNTDIPKLEKGIL